MKSKDTPQVLLVHHAQQASFASGTTLLSCLQTSEEPAEYEEPPDFLGEEPQFGEGDYGPEAGTTSGAPDTTTANEKETKPQAQIAAVKRPAPEQTHGRPGPDTGRRASRRCTALCMAGCACINKDKTL